MSISLKYISIYIFIYQYINKYCLCQLQHNDSNLKSKKKAFEGNHKNMYAVRFFPWDCSSIGQSTALSRRKLRVRAPSVPIDTNPIKKKKRKNSSNKEEKEFLIESEIDFWNLVWIKDLPMLYYSILDDESVF